MVVTPPLPPQHEDGDNDNKILSWDAWTLSNAIQIHRTVSCYDVMRATLDRIERINPIYNAVIMLKPRAELLMEAQQADEYLAKLLPVSEGQKVPRLYGIPTAIKDVSNVVGFPTSMGGSPLLSLTQCTRSDPYVENMMTRGGKMLVVGKTNTPEAALGSHTINDMFGATLNPFDTTKSAGVVRVVQRSHWQHICCA